MTDQPETTESTSAEVEGYASLRLTVELEYDAASMHGDDVESAVWFFEHVLKAKDGLHLHSNEIGDTVGMIRVLTIDGDA